MLKRWLLVLFVLVALPAYANVAQDDGTVQVGDPDAAGSTAPIVNHSPSPGKLPLPGGKTPAATGAGTGGSAGGAKTPGENGSKMGQGTPQDPAGVDPQEDLARQLDGPMPMENPYTLIAVGILLLLLALIGGLYFYRNRDREEPLE